MLKVNVLIRAQEWLGLLIVSATVIIFSVRLPFGLMNKFIDDAERKSFDARMVVANAARKAFRVHQPVDPRIQLIGIKTHDYIRYREEFDSREIYAELLEFLRRSGVESVICDVFFDGRKVNDVLFALNMGEPGVFIPYVFTAQDTSQLLYSEVLTDAQALLAQQEIRRKTDEELQRYLNEELLDTLEEADSRRERIRRNVALDPDERHRQSSQVELHKIKTQFLIWAAAKEWIRRRWSIGEIPPGGEEFERGEFIEIPSVELLLKARGLGFINVREEPDGVFRRMPLVMNFEDRLYPSIDLVWLCHYYGVSVQALQVVPGHSINFSPTRNSTADVEIPIDREGKVLLEFSEGEELIRRAFFVDELLKWKYPPPQDRAEEWRAYQSWAGKNLKLGRNPRRLKGCVAILGESRESSTDVKPIPLANRYAMFATHAHLINMVLHGNYVLTRRPLLVLAVNLVLGLMAWLIVNGLPYRRIVIAFFALLLTWLLLSVTLFIVYRYTIDVVRPSLTIVFGSLFLLAYRIGIVEKDDRLIRNFFDRMVSPEVVKEILVSGDRASLYGANRRATILFADLRGFTSLLEQHSADTVLDVLNEYYDRLSAIIIQNHGHVNKFIGDAVLALYGVPQPVRDAEWLALKSAIEIRRSIAELNQTARVRELNIELRVGIGINTGEVVAGMVGGEQTKREYTALGDEVNIAERLQQLARRGEILIGEPTYIAIFRAAQKEILNHGLKFERREGVAVKGRKEELNVYEVVVKA